MKKVTDPALLAELNGKINYDLHDPLSPEDQALLKADATNEALRQGRKVTDPALLAELNGIQESKPEMSWGNVAANAIGNIPGSAAGFVGGIAHAVAHPIDTALGVHSIISGGAQNLLPESLQPDSRKKDRDNADVIGHYLTDRYGSEEGFKNALAHDPVGVLSDASTVLMGGGALAKAGGLVSVGDAAINAGKAFDPLIVASKNAVNIGKGAANIIGGIGTHTGGESLKIAAKAGITGGEMGKNFIGNMRGTIPIPEVLDKFKQNLSEMGAKKSAEYRAGMAQVSGDTSILDFTGIDDAIKNSFNAITFKGQAKNEKALKVHNAISKSVDDWKALDPAEYHTPEGLDALKQQIGGIQESIPFEEKTARMAAGKIYNAIKEEIAKQAPVYSKTMKDYSDASELITEIERTLSMKGTASVDQSMRKLQSLMRNNANTNYGNRLALARQVEEGGHNEIMSSLAGQALNTWTPRGLGSAMMGGLGMGAQAIGGYGLSLPTLALQSPRLMGEAAYHIGAASKMAPELNGLINSLSTKIGVDPIVLRNILYQSGDKANRIKK